MADETHEVQDATTPQPHSIVVDGKEMTFQEYLALCHERQEERKREDGK